MEFLPTLVEEAHVIELDRFSDDCGFFACVLFEQKVSTVGLAFCFVQLNNSLAASRSALCSLHNQLPPAAEVKMVRCVCGMLFDVVADLRPTSHGYGR